MELHKDFISTSEELELIKIITSQKWSDELKRKTQQYGYHYNYNTPHTRPYKIEDGKLPSWLSVLVDRLVEKKIFDEKNRPDQVIINHYDPSVPDGINSHIDNLEFFGPVIASVTLNSGTVMDFKGKDVKKSIYLHRKSLLVLQGDYRDKIAHGIAARKSDNINGIKKARGVRISITFRKMK
jgi:alkylated DNA repair dioxygenase AlkB